MGFAKVETLRLKYIATHQTDIRADLYQNVRDAVAADAGARPGQPEPGQPEPGQPQPGQPQPQRGAGDEAGGQPALGRRVVLPATFIGGPRHMRQR